MFTVGAASAIGKRVLLKCWIEVEIKITWSSWWVVNQKGQRLKATNHWPSDFPYQSSQSEDFRWIVWTSTLYEMRKYWKRIYYKDCFTINKLVLHVSISHTLTRHTSHHNLITLSSTQIIQSRIFDSWLRHFTGIEKINLATLANMFTVYAILDSFFSFLCILFLIHRTLSVISFLKIGSLFIYVLLWFVNQAFFS